ncbi:MAG: AAA family ATPase, partial [Deltaproteobacteria bacterium]|nr:AAA family ATPase [Deltaproteobacteria bacterium]
MSENPPGPSEKLSGQVEKVTFNNPENGYSVVQIKVRGQALLVTAVGCLGRPADGEILELTGRYTRHPKFGSQFEVSSYEAKPPQSAPGLTRYLASGLIPGIGPVLAARMVKIFGSQVLEVLDKEPQRLIDVPGLGHVRRESIIKAWQTTGGLRRLFRFLAAFGLGPAMAQKIMRQLGPQAEEIIKKDPYILAYKVEGIGFKSADRAAQALGWPEESPQRLEAALMYCLNESLRQGHTFLPSDELIRKTGQLIPAASSGSLRQALGRITAKGLAFSMKQALPYEQNIYLPRLYRAEVRTAMELINILNSPPSLAIPKPDLALAWSEKELGLTLSPDQKQAVSGAITRKAVIITGGPGTGKTTITKAICRIFQAVKARIALCAPTGRAAKRLSQATGLQALTIHRLLEYSPQDGRFARDPGNLLELDMLLVDEASMLDILVASSLLGALPKSAVLILIGDRDQLPPVGPGRVLGDILDSGKLEVHNLSTIYRQASRSLIIEAAHLINSGQSPADLPQGPEADFHFVEENDPAKIREKIVRLVAERIPRKLS